MEYFINEDPGFGNAVPLSFSSDPLVDRPFTLDLTGQDPGINQLFIRAKDDNGSWSLTSRIPFFIVKQQPDIQSLEYFFDQDPGFGNGTVVDVVSTGDMTYSIDLASAGPGFQLLCQRSLIGKRQ